MTYVVEVNDQAGRYLDVTCCDFEAVLATVRDLAAKFPWKVVCACNLDRADYDTNGLTEDERGQGKVERLRSAG